MRNIKFSNLFKKDIRRCEKRGRNMKKMKAVIELIVNDMPLPFALKDHPLKGVWKPHRELHIEPDWLLIYYCPDEVTVHFERTGTHSDLFG
ncbi:addiction module toxin, RelE/StbE family protein [Commensalibacter intestini]|uniref:Addiction module toxin, RelE/StbE family protein n=2 Tax=Commensalibacter intestini TaxID=479936 RepID=A0A251ZTI7_9PROT|nr:type II toxin-antitoxin system mRNA interferase toxin, RelE/StbE family [Commensalibacter intestini]OUI77993.1 addiction module toxin, RelE/StbE family protein [Commensalibacter intestini]